MKTRRVWIGGGLLIFALLIGYAVYALSIQSGQDTVVHVYRQDQNGAPLEAPNPVTLAGKVGHRNKFEPTVAGYNLRENPLPRLFPRQNQTVRLTYQSALTKAEIRKTVVKAVFWQVGIQSMATPIFDDTQYQRSALGVARISTSRDGKLWTKLPISYPRTELRDPSMLYQHQRLTLFDQQTAYVTTNFVNWQRYALKLTNSTFHQGRVRTIFHGNDGRYYLIVQATVRATGQSKLYYGQLLNLRGRVTTWHPLKVKITKRQPIIGLSQLDDRLYVMQRQKQHIHVYRAANLAANFKQVARVKVHGARKLTINSVNLIQLSVHRYRLVFNLVDRHLTQQGTFYRNLTAKLNATGRQERLTTDFMWQQFQLIEHLN